MPFVLILMLTLAASESNTLDPGVLALCIPVVAIICVSLTVIVKSIIKHRERMAKIGMGIDPDTEFTASQYPPVAPPPAGGHPPHPNA